VKFLAQTLCGSVEGQRRAKHTVFRGIPYAKPPVGARRFAAPEPPEPWSGVRDATQFGPIAQQGLTFASGMDVAQPQSEDCLTLSIYTPGVDAKKRPVLFWIHGGAYTVGASSMPLYDGGLLCELGDVVVVAINYRLGVFGFLYLGDEGEHMGATPNLAILDQIAALGWVRDNIAEFGGDPANVTIFGESAGGTSVSALLIAPKARGLFSRAIAQSPALQQRLPSHESAERVTHAVLSKLGIARGSYARLRELSAEQLIGAQREAEKESLGWRAFFPVRHADSLPIDPERAYADPGQPHIPLIVGSNRDEWNLFDAANIGSWALPMNESEQRASLDKVMQQWLPGTDPARAQALFDVYARSRRGLGLSHDPRSLLRAIEGDLIFRMAGVRLAEANTRAGNPVYAYLFNYVSPALRGALGACHALDLPFVFGTYDTPTQERFAGTGPAVQALSASMMGAWLSFARLDAPCSLAEWRPYDLERRPTLIFDKERSLALDPLGEERAAWEGLL
jgi:para-nitrobenzyl esterase